jgi:hypothetical protein
MYFNWRLLLDTMAGLAESKIRGVGKAVPFSYICTHEPSTTRNSINEQLNLREDIQIYKRYSRYNMKQDGRTLNTWYSCPNFGSFVTEAVITIPSISGEANKKTSLLLT